MSSTLVDSPPADPGELAPSDAPAGPPAQPDPPRSPVGHTCAKCGAAMVPGQDWCLQCGAGAPGSMGSSGWRSAATILGVTVVLALGAAAAAYAALNKTHHAPPTVTRTVAQATPPPVATTPVPPIPSIKSTLPPTTVKPPKIPLTVPKIQTPTVTPTTTTPSRTPSTGPTGGSGAETQPAAILLDTNAASTYNPYNYPASDFGDPSLTIDGDNSTAWTAQVEPATAPKMAEGVLINLNGRQKIASLKLTSSTPGMTIQIYGAQAKTAPTSITDPAWKPLSRSQVVAKKHVKIKLKDATKSFSFITLWISNAPAASVGTPQAPGHVSVNEIELFPAG